MIPDLTSFSPWANPYGANGKMTLHNFRSEHFHRTLNGKIRSAVSEICVPQNLAAACPPARPRPDDRPSTIIPLKHFREHKVPPSLVWWTWDSQANPSAKCWQLFLGSCPTYPENIMKIRPQGFLNVANRYEGCLRICSDWSCMGTFLIKCSVKRVQMHSIVQNCCSKCVKRPSFHHNF